MHRKGEKLIENFLCNSLKSMIGYSKNEFVVKVLDMRKNLNLTQDNHIKYY